MDICPKCGLPIAACVCEEIAKTQQEVEVKLEKRRFGKVVTLVSGLEGVDLKEIAKKLKNKLACGGTISNKIIELQGNHLTKVKPVLIEAGFSESLIKERH
jgi:translation initiation factor 1